MPTPSSAIRIPPELEAAARAGHPELANENISVLVRAGLAVLAGLAVGEVIGQLRGKGRGSRLPIPSQPNQPDNTA
jgi:hypothetical protein